VTALTDATYQNTAGNSQGQPLGLSWDTGYHMVQATPPSGYSSVTGWGQIYQEAGASVGPNAATDTVQIEDFTTYVHLTNGTWVEVQNQAQNGIGGAHYVADFSGGTIPWSEQTLSDGSVSADAPPAGYNDHFWPGVRGTFTAGTVDGVFVEATMKTNDPNANLVASVGADWWQTATSGLPSSGYNPGVGQDDWVKLTTNWQTLYFSSLSAAQLAADPPPGLQTTTPPPLQPAVTTATAAPGSGVEHVGDTVALTLGFNEAVTVTGKPTLTLNDGSTATYVSGSGTNALVFSTTVAATNTATSALAVTGVNLASGAAIKDASGLAANLSGAATTFTGLQIDPTPVSTPPVTTPPGTGSSGGATPPTGTGSGTTVGTGASGGATPPTVPVVSVTDHSLSVSRGQGVSLGVGVSVPNAGDKVTVNITGLPQYETITDNLDHKTFRGSSITLTAAEVNSGLTLTTNYRGHGDPSATLTVTATDKAGTPVTSAPQTITVKDPPASSGTSAGGGTNPVTGSHRGTGSNPGHGNWWGQAGQNSGHSDRDQWFGHHPDFAPVATTLSDAGATKSAATPSVGTAADPVGSVGAKSYALLNQMMAGDFGRDSHFAQVATASTASLQQSAISLTKPLH
jgi:hypothetical protein